MSSLYHEYLVEDRDFTDYEDFKNHCRLKTKQDFNFAYDIVDRYASDFPGKRALVWINDDGEERTFTFDDISRESKRAAYWLVSKGIKKGDTVMLVLRRRYEWWILMPALHRIGAIVIPATDQLLQSDIEYRTNAADVKMIISYDNPIIQGEIEKSMPNSKTVQYLVTVGKEKRGCGSVPLAQASYALHTAAQFLSGQGEPGIYAYNAGEFLEFQFLYVHRSCHKTTIVPRWR